MFFHIFHPILSKLQRSPIFKIKFIKLNATYLCIDISCDLSITNNDTFSIISGVLP